MGTLRVIGDGMVVTAVHVKQGDLLRRGVDGVHAQSEPKSRERRAGVRALIVAEKRRNGRGAKGGRKVDAVKDRHAEEQPEAVPARATRAGDIRARWAWTEPSVWTERMLTALEEGVKGGRRLLCQAGVVLHDHSLCSGASVLSKVNRRRESRMRENRTYGLEGGGTGSTGSSHPYSAWGAPLRAGVTSLRRTERELQN